MTKISIVTISFNQSRFLDKCLDSVSGQDFSDYEHIVVDAGSTDGSREIIESHPSDRLRPIYRQDSGPAEGLNNGFESADSPIIVYINADDELAPGALSKFVEVHERDPGVDVVIGNGWLIDAEGRPIVYSRSDRFTTVRAAVGIGTVLQQATSYRRDALRSRRPFNEASRYTWDLALLCDLHADRAKFHRVDDTLGYFRIYGETITGTPALARKIRDERYRILSGHLGPWVTPLRTLNVPARVVKRIGKTGYMARHRPSFPGHVKAPKEREYK